MMPNMDGFELCSQLRRNYENLPILMLTAKGELASKVKGFGLGADDYLTKPFEDDELILRIQALLRRYKIETSKVIQIGHVIIDKNKCTYHPQRRQRGYSFKGIRVAVQTGGLSRHRPFPAIN